jgi:hypothetical protein
MGSDLDCIIYLDLAPPCRRCVGGVFLSPFSMYIKSYFLLSGHANFICMVISRPLKGKNIRCVAHSKLLKVSACDNLYVQMGCGIMVPAKGLQENYSTNPVIDIGNLS